MVDDVFYKLYSQDKISWSTEGTPFTFPVFIVWKTVFIGPEKILYYKGRVVVDIRGLNRISTPNVYPILYQEDITAVVARCPYITVTDSLSFFY
jgi:hypothetical protein